MPEDMLMKTVVRETTDNKGPEPVGVAGVDTDASVTVFAMPIWKMIGVRVVRIYLQAVLGLLTADGVGAIDLAHQGDAWAHIREAMFVSLAVAFMGLLQNSLEFLTKIDVNKPGLRA